MPGWWTHDQVRYGITTVCAALHVAAGEVIGTIRRRLRASSST
ncbi:hypothetical protein ACQEXF_59850 [Streptomyces sp. CA-106131]